MNLVAALLIRLVAMAVVLTPGEEIKSVTQTLGGLFSAGSEPIFSTKYVVFCSEVGRMVGA